MAWWYIVIAGIGEIGWAIGLKYSEGFTRLWPSVGTAIAFIFSMFFLSLAMRTLPVGSAYAVWTGIGVVGTAILGMILFNEPRDLVRILCIGLIVAGIVGLKFLTPSASS
jgi:quaternary ammonium compound-resistance protein SugE